MMRIAAVMERAKAASLKIRAAVFRAVAFCSEEVAFGPEPMASFLAIIVVASIVSTWADLGRVGGVHGGMVGGWPCVGRVLVGISRFLACATAPDRVP